MEAIHGSRLLSKNLFLNILGFSWTTAFTPKVTGEYKIVVRATDKTGKVQISNFADPYPNGASGYNMITKKFSFE